MTETLKGWSSATETRSLVTIFNEMKARDQNLNHIKANNSLKVSDPTMGKEASPVEHGCEGEDGECKECQAKKCITGCAQTFRC